ncbi:MULTISPECIES: helix-turn-helix domain-containing protein [Pseudomonas]|jgi:DNA-binding XRE family transcriptional regulator|uniref:helix-turn-helix domain-containing protein n=1 Tax=Pseudomonas TaxID=286 RepID=UPI000289C657|nr:MULTISPECIES: helix-turn-helix transcriptional regulator [Pseudomonas]AMB78939.1 Cro/Cl family transcriptional regulator [Pseudomonas fragi]MCB1653519.1 helix-turn-helix domain-containing protein [Pseudomonadales bacterium]NBF14626.1 helix-turn-helix domain-containing protein [Pseudomonas sp. Fl4BN2]NNG61801.1 helix-turn-helix domain-containing protein [Pseudomonas sp. GC01]AUB74635.1 transcriptional regulator [Pseudomonas sp. Lz4W]
MDVQVIKLNGEPEYAVLPWASYQALLKAAGLDDQAAPPTALQTPETESQPPEPDQVLPGLDQLRGLRESKGLALEVLARTVGISPSYLVMIETGERLPDLAIRRSLAWEMGVPGWRETS